jgi:hypothetical protein
MLDTPNTTFNNQNLITIQPASMSLGGGSVTCIPVWNRMARVGVTEDEA